MPFEPIEINNEHSSPGSSSTPTLPGPRWHAIIEHSCSFDAEVFFTVSTNLIQNPNITSSHLFRADILYDSQDGELEDSDSPRPSDADVRQYATDYQDLPGFKVQRVLVRRFVPRNPTLDKTIDQTCLYLQSEAEPIKSLVIMRPNVDEPERLPWYHPVVQAIAYQHVPSSPPTAAGTVAVHYQLFPSQSLPLESRLLRTARSLLRTMHKHGEGTRAGYVKKGRHDQLLPQKRVQDTYSALKLKHAKRLCDAWVEQTEPSKHVFEDLSIAAYLIELWRDMYAAPDAVSADKPPFPGFADIGCGNGVLTEILLLEGYRGEGFDARRRKTWSVLSPLAQSHLHETLFVPQPLFDLYPAPSPEKLPQSPLRSFTKSLLSSLTASAATNSTSTLSPPKKAWHNGQFPRGTFIVSNHADELTPWTPLLAALTGSPFLAIPCCSHNLSGARFRAPSAFNSHSADAAAPSYFAAQKAHAPAKSVAISIPGYDHHGGAGACAAAKGDVEHSDDDDEGATRPVDHAAERGSLAALSPAARKKQPSAYASLCDWVTHLSREIGFDVESDMLRIPSTRNFALVARSLRLDPGTEPEMLAGLGAASLDGSQARREKHVMDILRREGADGHDWVRRCEGVLAKASDGVHM